MHQVTFLNQCYSGKQIKTLSADHFHKDVESAMRHEEKVCDWEDFTSCVEKHGKAVDMQIENFFDFPNALSMGKASKEAKPLLADVFVAE